MRVVDVASAVRGTIIANSHLVKIEEPATAIHTHPLELPVEFRHHIEIAAEFIGG